MGEERERERNKNKARLFLLARTSMMRFVYFYLGALQVPYHIRVFIMKWSDIPCYKCEYGIIVLVRQR